MLAVATLAMGMLAGCGPIGYMQQVHRSASQAVEDARRAGAESAAPYEYTSAVAYLEKAREEGAEAQYGNAIELGRRAEELARQARAIASRNGTPGVPSGRAPRESDQSDQTGAVPAEPPPAGPPPAGPPPAGQGTSQ